VHWNGPRHRKKLTQQRELPKVMWEPLGISTNRGTCSYQSADYKEEQLRAEFLNHFFSALCCRKLTIPVAVL